jgi:serine/threonine protein kinase
MIDSRTGPAKLEEVLDQVRQICDALEYLHANRVLMRDLKPANLMLDRSGRIRLIDFGIARVERGGDRTVSAIKGFGTAGFAPVEQYGHGHTDTRSDIYALGATVHALICGERPPESVSLATGDASLAPMVDRHPDVPSALDRVVARLMSTRKEDRPGTVAEARHALEIAFIKPCAPPPPLSATSVFNAPSRPVQVPNGPLVGTQGLRMLEPYNVVFSGTLEGARAALAQAAQAGMHTQMLRSADPYLTMRPQCWIVLVRHEPVRGGADAWTRQIAS